MQRFEARLKALCPLSKQQGVFASEAAVALLLTRPTLEQEPMLVLTRRATHLRTHAGEIAFPGGKWEPGDTDLAATALRESWEEINIPTNNVELIATLPSSSTRRGTVVTPYIGWIDSLEGLIPNADELDRVFSVPLSYLQQDPRIRTDVFIGNGRKRRIPVYEYAGFTIWGFTAAVIVQLLNSGFDTIIDTQCARSDERIFSG